MLLSGLLALSFFDANHAISTLCCRKWIKLPKALQLLSKNANNLYTLDKIYDLKASTHMLTLRLKIVHATIANRLSIDDNIDAPATKFADLGVDSLDTVEIMMALKEKFGVSIGEGGA
ncbi:acyl carrier protein 2, chloroplastic [Lactuca sativa]|uniref:Carrier domain-containing protein n=1 Tax=Lactuca sativa TaxID=4236 RepID=A0A9R1XS90_LACSA|nr:acyl carrier protein 2, chloroplastic [Lactuca sativa]KAJ0225565.1 hypothetical protein LSAT_V11C100025750 [Lactuca sativa]